MVGRWIVDPPLQRGHTVGIERYLVTAGTGCRQLSQDGGVKVPCRVGTSSRPVVAVGVLVPGGLGFAPVALQSVQLVTVFGGTCDIQFRCMLGPV